MPLTGIIFEMVKRQVAPRLLILLLAVAAITRVWLQMAAMPPYSGLDEIYHVARLAFVAQEQRNPTMREPSVPPYLSASIAGDADALPAFGVIGANWPKVVRARPVFPAGHSALSSGRRYDSSNYEAQQPSLYYLLAAPVVRLLPQRTPLQELRLWRALSAVCAVIIILATAIMALRLHGPRGALVATLLLSMPTWLTLVVRAGNDALACALIAVGYAVTFSSPSRWRGWMAEALVWSLALATKLYSWPAAIVLPFVWHSQRAPRARRVLVLSCGAAAVLITIIDLALRTSNPLGLFAFDRVSASPSGPHVPIAYGEMLKIIAATGVWTSAQHWNALTPLAMILYLGPVAALLTAGLARYWSSAKPLLTACVLAAVGFALAQVVNAGGYIRQAHAAGLALPAGGKEGWYWYALAPLFFCGLFGVPIRYLPRWVVAALVAWMIGWDVLIHEGALFQDFAGTTSALAGDGLFRWGPRSLPFSADLSAVGVGPAAASLTMLRVIELVCVAGLSALALSPRPTSDQLPAAD